MILEAIAAALVPVGVESIKQLVTRFVGGVNALHTAPAPGALALPRLAPVAYTPAGEDLVVWGDLDWPQTLAVRAEAQQERRP